MSDRRTGTLIHLTEWNCPWPDTSQSPHPSLAFTGSRPEASHWTTPGLGFVRKMGTVRRIILRTSNEQRALASTFEFKTRRPATLSHHPWSLPDVLYLLCRLEYTCSSSSVTCEDGRRAEHQPCEPARRQGRQGLKNAKVKARDEPAEGIPRRGRAGAEAGAG